MRQEVFRDSNNFSPAHKTGFRLVPTVAAIYAKKHYEHNDGTRRRTLHVDKTLKQK